MKKLSKQAISKKEKSWNSLFSLPRDMMVTQIWKEGGWYYLAVCQDKRHYILMIDEEEHNGNPQFITQLPIVCKKK